MLSDIEEGLTWEEGAARDEAWEKEQVEAYRLARIWGSQPDDVTH